MHEPINERSYGVVVVYARKGSEPQVLVLRHREGHWSLPKGHAEAGETQLQTAIRELKEETGITAIDIDPEITFKQRYSYPRQDGLRNKEVIYYLGMVDSPEVTLDADEVIDYRWVPLSGLKDALVVNGQTHQAAEQIVDYVTAYPGLG